MQTLRSWHRRLAVATAVAFALSWPLAVLGGHALADTITDLQFHSGNVMPSTTTYAIFWLPPIGGQPSHFEPSNSPTTNTNCPGATSSDAIYMCLMKRYFSDVGSTSFYNILTQY